MSRSISLAAFCVLAGCTFNVNSFTTDVPSTAPESPAHLRGDFSHLANLAGFGVRVEGSPTTSTTSARVTVAGLLGSGADASTITAGVHVDWPADASDPTTRSLVIGYDGPALETAWTEGVTVSLPATTSLDLVVGSTSIEVDGVTAPVHVVASSGSIDVRGAGEFALEATSGSISVDGRGGSARCTSGSIDVRATQAMTATTESGSIAGTFGGGGEMSATSGSIAVRLVGALDRDLTLSAGSGSIELVVPVGTSMRVETHTGSGSSSVRVGGVEAGDDFTGTIGSGGFLVRATTGSGSISITEL